MAPPRHIFALICANGLGHFRRTIGVLDRLLARAPDVELELACDPRAFERTRAWPAALRVRARARVHGDLITPAVGWSPSPDTYAGGVLQSWEEGLAACRGAREADLFLSDNLAGALSVRSDAILLGSFLWSDVLEAAHPTSGEVARFVEHERELLARWRPPMLCVGPLVMPGVRARTRAIELPFMCEERPLEPPEPRDVLLIAGGATGAADDVLARAERALAGVELAGEGGPLEVARPGFAGGGELDVTGARLVVARPGVGTITACVAAGTPMVLAYEAGNVELQHNAARAQALGFALDAGAAPSGERVRDEVLRALAPSTHRRLRAAARGMPAGGLEAAAEWLASRGG